LLSRFGSGQVTAFRALAVMAWLPSDQQMRWFSPPPRGTTTSPVTAESRSAPTWWRGRTASLPWTAPPW